MPELKRAMELNGSLAIRMGFMIWRCTHGAAKQPCFAVSADPAA